MKKLIKRHKPTIVALLETRVLASHAAGIVGRLGFSKSIVIDPEGFSGGMCLLWDPEEVDIQDTKESRWVIHAVVTAKFKSPWILSSIYGSTNKVTRKRIWDELEAIAEFGKTGHMVMGDLNTIGARNEKAGGKEPSANQLQELKDVMDQCGLIDLGANGPKFTWNNKRPGLANIKERLDHVLANEEWCKSFKNAQGFTVARGAPMITHSLYEDDNIIFLKANYKNACNLRYILDKFSKWSGQVVSDAKSTLLTSNNLGRSFTMSMAKALRVQVAETPGKYLGIPLQWGRVSEKTFADLLEKLSNKMVGWKSKSLNIAGRTILIKSVLDTVSNHVMSMLKFPKGLVNKIDKFRRDFLWGGDKDSRKMHNINWLTVCSPVVNGGLGVRDLDFDNMALLAKMAWRVSKNPESEVASLLKAKYIKDSDFWSSKSKNGCTTCWRSLVKGKDIIKGSLRWCICDGSQVDFWRDTWIDELPLSALNNMEGISLPDISVKDVIKSSTRQ
ncbi:uncharacterized protein LOC113318700 isoform X1 [Papaver somniferum]|uniref:uncharacterized protein LOC113318700 isoform X1 n=1 Tax=Papaver somniferum TaxID=3469 RepID=UPI000E6FF087|nr:uncharacterized protein LOC113318700 isoform X1 [Papaver somniferum]